MFSESMMFGLNDYLTNKVAPAIRTQMSQLQTLKSGAQPGVQPDAQVPYTGPGSTSVTFKPTVGDVVASPAPTPTPVAPAPTPAAPTPAVLTTPVAPGVTPQVPQQFTPASVAQYLAQYNQQMFQPDSAYAYTAPTVTATAPASPAAAPAPAQQWNPWSGANSPPYALFSDKRMKKSC